MRLTQEMIFETALRQSAIDANCRPEDFLRQENVEKISGVAAGLSVDLLWK